jgi:hypothetical protein
MAGFFVFRFPVMTYIETELRDFMLERTFVSEISKLIEF